ncbi:hypothetical protein [uncultured virus]|uniref:Uncharacterized protein n=1 Tax=uncultured virus TaxID=340016 RepID=A0A5Q0TWW2_9VIRU|nr:hypothetical protein [uncultured virus]
MEKRVRIKIGNVVIEMPKSVALQNPYYKILLQQGSMEMLQTEVQTPSSDTEKEEKQGSVDTSAQTLPHKIQRRGRRKKETEEK